MGQIFRLSIPYSLVSVVCSLLSRTTPTIPYQSHAHVPPDRAVVFVSVSLCLPPVSARVFPSVPIPTTRSAPPDTPDTRPAHQRPLDPDPDPEPKTPAQPAVVQTRSCLFVGLPIAEKPENLLKKKTTEHLYRPQVPEKGQGSWLLFLAAGWYVCMQGCI